MSYIWSKIIFPIASLYAFRMLGLLMLIPVFTLYAQELTGANPTLIGFALGCYGFTQGILQIPFGVLSDKFGRKPLLFIGFSLFALGSIIGGFASSINVMIIARLMQGMGAVGSVLIALLADLTPNEVRTKAMAAIGGTIGVSFSIAMILGPLLAEKFGLSSIFYLTACLAITALCIVSYVIPQNNIRKTSTNFDFQTLKVVFADNNLIKLYLGIFIQHLILTATFFLLPMQLNIFKNQNFISSTWKFYLPLMLISFLLMLPCIMVAEKKAITKKLYFCSILGIATSQILLFFYYHSWYGLILPITIYFLSFNILEALLPSITSKIANPDYKGTVMGIYSSSQFLGIFSGGIIAGLLSHHATIGSIFFANAICAIIWLSSTQNLQIK